MTRGVPRHRSAARLVASAVALAMAAGGCSLIVSGDVPEFQCLPGTAAACPTGMTCNSSARCVVDEGGIIDPIEAGEEDAPDEDVRDAGKDADAGPAENGTKCRVDNECKSRLCGSSTILTSAITASTGPICTSTCCRSEDCAPSFVCFNGGTGGGYCVPASLAQRMPASSGGKTGGTTCSTNTECRSGLCTGSPKRCLDTCCNDAQCGTGSVCRIKAVGAPGPNHDTWVCAAAETGAAGGAGAACTNQPAECKSDNCIFNICVPACSGHATCVAIPGFLNGLCRYGTSGADVFKYCQKSTLSGLANGKSCNADTDCQYDYCDGELKKCLNVCATDADCTPNETCRPSATGTPRLRCVLKP